jgi:hypothetical protein
MHKAAAKRLFVLKTVKFKAEEGDWIDGTLTELWSSRTETVELGKSSRRKGRTTSAASLYILLVVFHPTYSKSYLYYQNEMTSSVHALVLDLSCTPKYVMVE